MIVSKFNIKILSSGSQGNAILFNNSILLDTGISFKKLLPFNIKAVLLTHVHGDHFNRLTIRSIHINDDTINFMCGDFLKDELLAMGVSEKNIKIIELGKKYKVGGVIFSPIFLHHDVPNFGYRLAKNGYKHIHATDMFSMGGITAKNYDSATLEANHCIDSAKKIIEQKKIDREFCHMQRAIKTHLSVQNSVKFIQENNIKNYMPVHVGNSTRDQVEKYIKLFKKDKS